eukprot:g34.t1
MLLHSRDHDDKKNISIRNRRVSRIVAVVGVLLFLGYFFVRVFFFETASSPLLDLRGPFQVSSGSSSSSSSSSDISSNHNSKHSRAVKSNNGREDSTTKETMRRRYDFKIYVYDLPEWANFLVSQRDKHCRKSAFGTEIVIHERLLENSHGVRTMDPEEADFFYVPIYAACLVYKDFSLFEKYRFLVKKVIDFVIKKPYWSRSLGSDHIWPFVHDFGGCLSWLDNKDRIYYKELRNSIFLSHLGDLTMGCFSTHKDVVIPPLVADERILSTKPSTGTHNKYLVHFRGTVNWYHHDKYPELLIKSGVAELYSYGIRQHIVEHYGNASDMLVREGPSTDYIQEVLDSTFCLCPRGFAPWSKRLFDAVVLGCIPVIIADNIELPFEQYVDYRAFTVKVLDADVDKLDTILRNIPPGVVEEKQQALARVAQHFVYSDHVADGDAFDLVLWKLWSKVRRLRPSANCAWE